MIEKEFLTGSIKAQNIEMEVLKKHFSHCFDKDGNFQFDKFKQSLSEKEVNFSKESYSMDWLGKSYARLLASDAANTLLKEDIVHNQKEENQNAENLLLKGDNLEVLKHLTNAYYEKIKMIYIDPPYNTGKDNFVYEDNRKFSVEELQELAGIDEERAKRILDFTQNKSNSHSAWLTFMYPRLYVAKQLLREDGVIFISIDDSELYQLKLMMDDVFGEENFVGNLIVQTATDNNKTQINIEHEYIVSYVKNKNYQEYWEGKSIPAELIQEQYNILKSQYGDNTQKIQNKLRQWIRDNKKILPKVTHYDNVDNIGVYHDGDIANTKFGGYRYEIIHPDSGKPCKIPDKGFRFQESTMKKMIQEDNIQFGNDETTLIKPKIRLENVTDVLRSIIYEDGRTSSNYVNGLLDRDVFKNPKSHNILKRLLSFVVNKNDMIMDFFAGSGTTGDAVMQLNAEDGGNRKFILVQLPEALDKKKDKAAYDFVKNELKVDEPTIFEITKERLLRAAQKINKELNEKNKELQTETVKLKQELPTEDTQEKIQELKEEITQNKNLQKQNVFKIFETQPIWEDYKFEVDKLDPQIKLFEESKLTEDDIQSLLVTWKTNDGLELTTDLKSINFKGYIGYYGGGKLYLMHKGFSTENLKEILLKIDQDKSFNPTSIIAFGYHFESKNLREIAENVKSYSNKKNVDVDFIIRY